jgi:hypothetical protein
MVWFSVSFWNIGSTGKTAAASSPFRIINSSSSAVLLTALHCDTSAFVLILYQGAVSKAERRRHHDIILNQIHTDRRTDADSSVQQRYLSLLILRCCALRSFYSVSLKLQALTGVELLVCKTRTGEKRRAQRSQRNTRVICTSVEV